MIPYKYIFKKIIAFLAVLYGAITLNFLLPRLIPGNPAEIVYLSILKQGGASINPIYEHQLEAEYGISHAPMYIQYFQYLKDLANGNLGVSIAFFPEPVSSILREALPWTLYLVISSIAISFFIGNRLGRYAGINRNTVKDLSIDLFSMFMASFPAFVLAFIILDVFSVSGGVFPIGGAYSSTVNIGFNLPFIISAIYHSILPILTIVLTSIGGWVLGMRNNIIPNVNSDFIKFSETLGLRKEQINRIAYRNAILPNLTGFSMSIGLSVSGVIIEESIFSYPGVGLYMMTAIDSLDYPLIQGIFLMVIIAVLVGNAIVDILYGFFDPRIREEGE
ncbi:MULTISPECIES: ABC transporter permease [Ferroplasma]|jgi:peptide/nickel transport system permease protein|nr:MULTISPECIES: ABC transporter permease [Ferroplasma]